MTDTSVFDTGTSGVPYQYSGGGNLAPGATDYSGTYNDPYNPADPMNFMTGGYSGGYSSGLVDSSGQTIPQVMSSDPGNQLTQDQPPQQPVAQAGAGIPASGIPLVAQPSGLSNLVNQLVGGGGNPWMFGAGARQSPQVPVPSPQQMDAARGQLTQQLAARYPQPAPPAPESQPMPMPAPQPETASLQPTPGAKKEQPLTPPAEDSTDEGPQRTRTPETAPPTPQARPQQRYPQYPQSPLQGFINQLLGAMGIRPPTAQQGPYAGRPINQIPWMSPQQYQQYQQTGRFPSAVDPRTGLAPGFSRDNMGRITYKGQPPDMHIPDRNGYSQPAWSRDAIARGDNAERNAQQNGVFGAPPTNQAQMQRGARTTAGTPYLYSTDPSGRTAPYGRNFAGTQQPTAYDRWAQQGGTGTPPSQQPIGARFQVPPGASARQRLQYQVANEMAAGPNSMSNNAIAGVLPNIADESDWNPASSHYDQQRYSPEDEAAYSHGLLQEGGPDWPEFKRFLNGRDWRDPRLQIQFMKQHMQQRSPEAWQRMNNARTPGEAAAIFVHDYLRPAPQHERARRAQYLRGVPSAEQQLRSSILSGDESGPVSSEEERQLWKSAEPYDIQVDPNAPAALRAKIAAHNAGRFGAMQVFNDQMRQQVAYGKAHPGFRERFGDWFQDRGGTRPIYRSEDLERNYGD